MNRSSGFPIGSRTWHFTAMPRKGGQPERFGPSRPHVRLGTQSTGFELIILACRGRISTVEKTKVTNFVFLSLASAANRASGVGRGRISLPPSLIALMNKLPPKGKGARDFAAGWHRQAGRPRPAAWVQMSWGASSAVRRPRTTTAKDARNIIWQNILLRRRTRTR